MEITQRAAKIYPDKKDQVSDYCAGILNMFIGIGQATGPVYGAHMVSKYNFRVTQDIVCGVVLIYGILYFVFGDGAGACKSLKNKKKDKRRTTTLRNRLNDERFVNDDSKT
jgi:dipeptide/tripeptide permease